MMDYEFLQLTPNTFNNGSSQTTLLDLHYDSVLTVVWSNPVTEMLYIYQRHNKVNFKAVTSNCSILYGTCLSI